MTDASTASRSLAPHVQVGDVVDDKYELVRKLEHKGMAYVYEARDRRLSNRYVAIKMVRIDSENGSEYQTLFHKECENHRHVGTHDHIVETVDAGTDKGHGVHFLVTRWLDGQTLEMSLKTGGRFDLADAKAIFSQLGKAVSHLCERGVVHRDLKPCNIFLTGRRGGDPGLKLLDLGIARRLDVEPDAPPTAIGTSPYVAPEQWGAMQRFVAEREGRTLETRVSPATDIVPLGTIAFRVLTGLGHTALWGESENEVPPERPPIPSVCAGSNAEHLPDGFDDWFARTTQDLAKNRWGSFAEAVGELQKLLEPRRRLTPRTVFIPLASAALLSALLALAPFYRPVDRTTWQPGACPSSPLDSPPTRGGGEVVCNKEPPGLNGTGCTLWLASAAGEETDDERPNNAENRALCAVANDFMASSKNSKKCRVKLKFYDHEDWKHNLPEYLKEPKEDVIPWVVGKQVDPYKKYLVEIPREEYERLQKQWLPSVRGSLGVLTELRYIVPLKSYVWGVYYLDSVWKSYGYEIPRNMNEFRALAEEMKDDGMVSPIAFGNAENEGWPAMGWFDILDIRLHGKKFHEELLQGRPRWREAKDVFEQWKSFKDYYPRDFRKLSYHQAIKLLLDEKPRAGNEKPKPLAGMMVIGGFVVGEKVMESVIQDIRVFSVPSFGGKEGMEGDANVVDNPIDGFVVTTRVVSNWDQYSRNRAAWDLIEYLGSEEAFKTYDAYNQGGVTVIASVPGEPQYHYRTCVQAQQAKLLEKQDAVKPFLNREAEARLAELVGEQLREFLESFDGVDSVLDTLDREAAASAAK